MLTQVHCQYIAERTLGEKRLTNQKLALEMSLRFPELGGVSKHTISRYRHGMDLHFLPPVPVTMVPAGTGTIPGGIHGNPTSNKTRPP
jgi:hypothetical protein